MMLRSFVASGLLCAVSAIAACSAPVANDHLAEKQQAVTRSAIKIIQHNLAGGFKNDGVNGLNALQNQIDNEFKPDVVLLQEVCWAQLGKLKEKYKDWGIEFKATRKKHPKCKDQPKGLVIMSRHGLANRVVHKLPDPDGDIQPWLLCASVTKQGVAADRIRACTTHLRAGKEQADDDARERQAKAIADAVAPEINDSHRLVIVTGDMNSEPDSSAMSHLYGIRNGNGAFYEADQTDDTHCPSGECRGGGPTFYKRKIDFVFLSKNRATGTLALGTKNTSTSDHRIVRAEAKVELTSDFGVNARQATEPGQPNDPANDADATAPVLPVEEPTEQPADPGDRPDPPPPPPPAECDNDCWRATLVPYVPYNAPAPIRDDRHLSRRVFDPRFYLSLYADVVNVGGANNWDYAEYHWLKNGIPEGRMGSPLFDAPYYLAVHPDVAAAYGATNYLGALDHYQDYGIAEGRRGSVVFDARYYMMRYPDLPAAFGGGNFAAALDHFQNNGLSEGRQASADFAPAWYLGNNPDVQAAFGATDFRAGLRHYLVYGRHEGRRGAP